MLASILVLSALTAGPDPEFRLAADPVRVGPMAGRPSIGDLDHDGDIDVVVTCGPCCGMDPSPDAGHVVVLINDGEGRLTARDPIKIGETALGSALGDVNGDGHLDAVCYHHSDYRAAVLLGDGKGGFAKPAYFELHAGESPHVHALALADVNNDGALDVLATLVDDHAVAVHLNDGSGRFTPALGQPFFAFRHPYNQLNTLDVNADGNVDCVLTDMRGGGLSVLVGSGTGMFASSVGFTLGVHTPITSAERPMAADVADVDRDGDLDAVAIIDESALAVVMINDGGVFKEHPRNPVRLAVPTTSVALVDLEGKGWAALVTGGTMTGDISVAMARTDGSFAEPYAVPTGGMSPAVVAADMNGDGKPDIVTGNYGSGDVSVLLQR